MSSIHDLLQPRLLPGDCGQPQLVRIGQRKDGGYLVPCDPVQSPVSQIHPSLQIPLVSFGIGWDISFELDWLRLTEMPVVCYDHTTTTQQWEGLTRGCSAAEKARLHYIARPAELRDGNPTPEALDHIGTASSWAIKMDIEAGEYAVLEQHGEALSADANGCALLVMELHWLATTEWYLRAMPLLEMLHHRWLLAHAHTNNYGRLWNDSHDNLIPDVVELTWLHRSLLPANWPDQLCPHIRPLEGLDFPNNGVSEPG